MTRERASEVLAQHLGHAAGLLDTIMTVNVVTAMVTYAKERADAEAAAMRERAAGVASDAAEAARPYANGVGLGPATERHKMLEAERIAAAIRALPATGEVGCE